MAKWLVIWENDLPPILSRVLAGCDRHWSEVRVSHPQRIEVHFQVEIMPIAKVAMNLESDLRGLLLSDLARVDENLKKLARRTSGTILGT